MSIQRFPNLTPSRAAALSCLKRFEAEHVLKTTLQTEFSQPMAYGSVVHETLKGVFDPTILLPPAQRNLQSIALKAIYRQNYPDIAMRNSDLEKCIATVLAYIEQSSHIEETIGVEVFDSVTIARGTLHPLTLGAKFDRLLVNPAKPNHLIIRDYKTGTPAETDLDGAAIMLAITAMRFKEYGGYSVEYDYINGHGLAERRIVTFSEAKAAWPDLKARALRIYNAQAFPAEPGEHCLFCPLRTACQPNLSVDMSDVDDLFA
jgi:RecB family exonuclease